MTQSAQTKTPTNTNNQSTVQRKEEGGGGNSALKSSVRGMSYAEGAAALSPVQMEGGGLTPGGGEKKETPVTTEGEHETPVKQDFGTAENAPQANGVIGSFIDSMTETPGQGFKGSLEIEVPIGVPGCFMALKLEGGAKRTLHGKREIEFKVRLTFLGKIDLHFVEIHAGVFGELGVKAVADSGHEAMQLMGLLLQQKVKGVSKKLANKIWGSGYEEEVVEQMDEQDEVEGEGSMGLVLGAGAHLGHGGHGPSVEGEVEGGVRSKTKLKKGADGHLETEHDKGLFLNVGVKSHIGPVEVEVKVESFFKREQGKFQAPDVKVEFEVLGMHGLETVSALAVGLADCVAPAINAIIKGSKGKGHEAEMHAQQLAGSVAMQPIAGRLIAGGLVHGGFGLILEWEHGKFKKYEVETIKKVELDIGIGKVSGTKTNVVAEGEVGGGDHGGGDTHGGGH